jgi:hypothetical protein
VLNAKGMSPKISVKDAILELSKIYVLVHGARTSLAEIPEKSQKMSHWKTEYLSRIKGLRSTMN